DPVTVRITAPNCDPVDIPNVNPCAGPIPPVGLTCRGPAVTITEGGPTLVPTAGGSGPRLVGGAAATGVAGVRLITVSGSSCNPAPGVTCRALYADVAGIPLPVVLTKDDVALVGVGGQAAVAGNDAVSGWTDVAVWAPRRIRAGLLAILALV